MNKTTASTPSLKTSDDIRAATAQFGALRNRMAFLVPLTETERKQHLAARLGIKALRTIANRLTAAREHRDHVPPAFDMRAFEDDATNTIALGEMLKTLDELRLVVHDTFMAVGQRASVAGASIYAYIQIGSITATRLKRTVDKLATRTVRGAVKEEPAAPEPLPAPANVSAFTAPAPAPEASTGTATEPTNKAA